MAPRRRWADDQAVPVFKLVIRASTGWSDRDKTRVMRSAGALHDPPSRVTDRGFELAIKARNAEAARTKVEAAVNGIHSHTGVYLQEELS